MIRWMSNCSDAHLAYSLCLGSQAHFHIVVVVVVVMSLAFGANQSNAGLPSIDHESCRVLLGSVGSFENWAKSLEFSYSRMGFK